MVHQTCQCESPLQCTCDQGVTYLLGDLDLCIPEGQQKDLPYTNNEWEKMADRDPAGTVGMKPPEVSIK